MNIFKYKRNKSKVLAIAAGLLVTISSCTKTLDILPQDKLDKTQVYNTLADADAAVIGIYGQFAKLGEKYILFNELRADLMDVTVNANPYLQQLSNHDETLDNPYIDPTDFYKVILNCNDAIKNFKIMLKQSKLSQEQFDQRFSDIVCLRSFIYLQLGIHYGNIPYITEPLETVDDLKASNDYPKINLDQLIDSLLIATNEFNLPYRESYAYPTTASLNFAVDGINTRKIFINKPELIGELNLWKGNYYEAAKSFKKILEATNNSTDVTEVVDYNRISYNFGNVGFSKSQTSSSLINSLTEGWRSFFSQPNTSRIWNSEWSWGIPYSNAFNPGNPFVELASQNGGKYMIKPSKRIIDIWDAQTLTNGIPYDARGKLSYTTTASGDPVITKLTDNVTTLSAINKGGNWNIYRAGSTHLKFAEAANRDGQGKLAYALLNRGIQSTFYDGAYSAAGAKIPSNLAELNTEVTPYPESSPYYFDARDGIIRGLFWYRNVGIRSRAMLPRLELPGIIYKDTTAASNTRRIISQFNVDVTLLEDKLIEEAAMELAFEGSRWSDLMRIARRRNNPAFLADKIYEKLLKAGNPKAGAVKAKLMDPANWYLPFKLK